MSGTIFFICVTSAVFSLLCCSQNFSLTSCTKTMAKRMQEQEGEERIVAKSEPTMKFFDCAKIRLRRKVRGHSRHLVKKGWSSTGKPDARGFNRDAASSSQGWQKDAVLDISTRRLVASGNSEIEGKDKNWPHNLHISKDGGPHMEKVFSNVRQRYGLSPRDEMKYLDLKATIC